MARWWCVRTFCCLVILFVLTACVQSKVRRFGPDAKTLHLPPLTEAKKLGEKFQMIEADQLINGKSFRSVADDDVDKLLRRFRRQARNQTDSGGTIETTAALLNDNHSMLIVHWAGERSPVIIALAKPGRHASGGGTSNVYISRDYGKSFHDITANVTGPNHTDARVDKYYNSDQMNSHYVFTALDKKCVFTTRDYCRTFTRTCGLPFRPKVVSLNPNNVNVILAFDEDDPHSPLFASEDFGRSWSQIRDEVKSFFWGVLPYDPVNTVYVEERRGSAGNEVLRMTTFSSSNRSVESVIGNVEDFQIQDEYLFATKRQHLLGSHNPQGTLQFWVSYKRQNFVNAQFPIQHGHSDYYVADASEGQVLLCVVHNASDTNLYISDVQGSRFSLSLERVVYFNPKGAHKDTWLSYYSNQTFADVHKVAGLRGIYIASQLISSNGSFSVENQRSLITYDKGGEWELLNSPRILHGRPNYNCSKSVLRPYWSKKQRLNCSLHLSQEFSRLYPGSQGQPVLSRASAPGILLSSGTVGRSLKSQQDLFVSRDAGYTWLQVMDGSYQFSMADHGGVMLAAQQFQPTTTVYYSTNQGETWNPYQFEQNEVRIYGILTEPGEKTTIFSVFGSKPDHHQWRLYQLNTSSLLSVRCSLDDYKDWSLPDALPGKGCLLGQKLVIRRRNPHSQCYNGEYYVPVRDLHNCSCTRDDYECDYGFKPQESWYSTSCVRDTRIPDSLLHKVPDPCPPGTLYPYTRGYRRVAGDTCSGGREHVYEPLKYSCPVQERSEFLLVSSSKRIQSVNVENFNSQNLFTLPTDQSTQISAVAFDYHGNTLFFSTYMPTTIKSVNLNRSSSEVVTLAEADHVTGLAFDWTWGALYWVDQGRRKIEVVNGTGFFRRTLVSREASVRRMMRLEVDPVHGYMYWLEDTDSNSRVMRAWMSGEASSVEAVTPTHDSGYVQGFALDRVHERLYVTSVDGHIAVMDTDGAHSSLLSLSEPSGIQMPGLIALYKESVVWINKRDNKLWGAPVHWDNAILPMKNFNDFVVIDMVVVSHISQTERGACTRPTAPCSQLCVPRPDLFDESHHNRTCLCGDEFGFEQHESGDQHCHCEGTLEVEQSDFCTINTNLSQTCGSDQFQCRKGGRCIPRSWRCDRDDDCRDMSDETDCPYFTCPSMASQCPSGKCIPSRWKCDFDDDCGDNSDEKDCVYPPCNSGQFTCNNSRCINQNYVCDLDDDCRDGSDEVNCPTRNSTCHFWEHTCDNGACVSRSAVCDGARDCSDGSDERNCSSSNSSMAPQTCQSYQFPCLNGRCVFSSWVCDGDNDCGDFSDERNCSLRNSTTVVSTTPGWTNETCGMDEFRCVSGFCIYFSAICDQINDCGDWSDEQFCEFLTTTTPAPNSTCFPSQFRCSSGQCIPSSQRCDNTTECWDNSDEIDCDMRNCPPGHFECYESGGEEDHCVWGSWRCDGDDDCPMGEDERYCNGTEQCPDDFFVCLNSGGCVPPAQRCNGHHDCDDHSDEENCQTSCDLYKDGRDACCSHGCAYLSCRQDAIEGCFSNDTSIGSSCSVHENNLCLGAGTVKPPTLPKGGNNFMCAWGDNFIALMYVCNGLKDCLDGSDEQNCNAYARSSQTVHLLEKKDTSVLLYWSSEGGSPSRNNTIVSYFPKEHREQWTNMTVKTNSSSLNLTDLNPLTTYMVSVYAPGGYPSPPLTTTTRPGYPSHPRHLKVVMDANVVRLSWEPPSHPNSHSVHYTVEVVESKSNVSYFWDTHSLHYDLVNLRVSKSYIFKVRAISDEGLGSKPAEMTFTYDLGHLRPPDVTLGVITDSSVQLSWVTNKDAVGYRVTAILYYQDARRISNITKNTSFTFDKLCSGQDVSFTVESMYDNDAFSLPSPQLTATVKGNPVRPVQNVTVQLSGEREVIVNYVSPANGRKDLVVYHVSGEERDLEEFFQKAQRFPTSNTSTVTVPRLKACERYFFRVGYGLDSCPVSNDAVIHTQEDDTGPPKDLRCRFEFHKDGPIHVNLTWKAPCDYMVVPRKYLVTGQRLDGSKPVKHITPSETRNASLHYLWTDVVRGGKYTFTVKTNLGGAQSSAPVPVNIPPYPAPEGFAVTPRSDNSVLLTWNTPKDKPAAASFLGYNLTLWQEDQLYVSTMVDAKATHFSHNVTQGFWYTVAIRVVVKDAPDGHTERQRFPYFLQEPGDGSQSVSQKHLVAILVPICLVIVALAIVVGVFVVRHRRLQRSFLAFANSHYNTRSGTTTFSSDLDDDEPMIQGFSDDEPLVLA